MVNCEGLKIINRYYKRKIKGFQVFLINEWKCISFTVDTVDEQKMSFVNV